MNNLRFILGKAVIFAIDAIIPARIKKILLYSQAVSAGVISMQCKGELGVFQGASSDQAVFHGYFINGTWAPGLQALLASLIPEGNGTLIDIGANIGLTSIPISKTKKIVCHAYEPEPENFRYLENNIEANEAGAFVSAHNIALYSVDTELQMEFSESNRGDHRIKATNSVNSSNAYGENSRKQYTVIARKLDSVLDFTALSKPCIMKVDVQGAEVDVLRGASNAITCTDYMILEFWPYGLRRLNHDPEELLELLKVFPFGAVLDEDNIPNILEPIENVLMKARNIPFDGSCTDHLDLFLSKSPVLPGSTSESRQH